jgi:hypothetical protein
MIDTWKADLHGRLMEMANSPEGMRPLKATDPAGNEQTWDLDDPCPCRGPHRLVDHALRDPVSLAAERAHIASALDEDAPEKVGITEVGSSQDLARAGRALRSLGEAMIDFGRELSHIEIL